MAFLGIRYVIWIGAACLAAALALGYLAARRFMPNLVSDIMKGLSQAEPAEPAEHTKIDTSFMVKYELQGASLFDQKALIMQTYEHTGAASSVEYSFITECWTAFHGMYNEFSEFIRKNQKVHDSYNRLVEEIQLLKVEKARLANDNAFLQRRFSSLEKEHLRVSQLNQQLQQRAPAEDRRVQVPGPALHLPEAAQEEIPSRPRNAASAHKSAKRRK